MFTRPGVCFAFQPLRRGYACFHITVSYFCAKQLHPNNLSIIEWQKNGKKATQLIYTVIREQKVHLLSVAVISFNVKTWVPSRHGLQWATTEWDGSSAAKVLRHIHNSVIGELFKVVEMVFRTPAVTKQFYRPLCMVSMQNACMTTPAHNKKIICNHMQRESYETLGCSGSLCDVPLIQKRHGPWCRDKPIACVPAHSFKRRMLRHARGQSSARRTRKGMVHDTYARPASIHSFKVNYMCTHLYIKQESESL